MRKKWGEGMFFLMICGKCIFYLLDLLRLGFFVICNWVIGLYKGNGFRFVFKVRFRKGYLKIY